MKTWIKRTLIGVGAATVLLGGVAAYGYNTHGGPWNEQRIGEMRGKVLARITDRLDLNAEQQARLETLADEMMAQRMALRGTQSDPRADLRALMTGTTFDRAAAQALLGQKTQAVQDNGPKVITAMADFYDSLNPQQQREVREKLDKRGHWGGRHGQGRHHGEGHRHSHDGRHGDGHGQRHLDRHLERQGDSPAYDDRS